MRVLVVGSGGREHTLCWKLSQCVRVNKIFCAPGNAGIESIARCIAVDVMDIPGLVRLAIQNEVELVVVGPEAPLTAGLVDELTAAGIPAFGPGKAAARLEGSKVFAKSLMEKYNIPTAFSHTFGDAALALAYLDSLTPPVVVKADGLAAGKGVVVAKTLAEAAEAVQRLMVQREFGDAGDRVIIEEFLQGEEVSLLAFTDGEAVIPMASSQDHKAVCDGDTGPNTGGMGAYSPAPVLTPKLLARVKNEILYPTIAGLRSEGITFKGVLYAGLMITAAGPKVLEYNVRFGDPECQAVLPRLQSDLCEVMLDVINARLAGRELRWTADHTACVVMASGGYPGPYEKGRAIEGLDQAAAVEGAYVFHAGTAKKGDKIVTAGGRVLGVTARGETLAVAIGRAYAATAKISFAGAHYRRDIGHRALKP